MAKAKTSDTGGRQKIRFVMLDADLSDGNLSELTTAITNALRPTVITRLVEPKALKAPNEPAPDEQPDPEDASAEIEEDADPVMATSPKSSVPRKLPQPKYLHDLDFSGGGTPFKKFAEEHAPKKHTRRYLVATYWANNYAKLDSVNIDTMYTLYKTAGWPTNIKDWDVNFRQLVKQEWLRRVETGEYAITPLGESKLQTRESDQE